MRGDTAVIAALRRISSMILRYVYLLRRSWPRILEIFYWPAVQMILWGFITNFFKTNSSWVATASGVLLSAVLLWDVLFRGQLGVSLVFTEELHSRNLGHLFASPLRPYEMVCALLAISLIRTVAGSAAAALLAIPLYHYSIFEMGLPLAAFFANLLAMGWSIGLVVSGLVLRYGLGVESLAWVAIFALAPVSGIYYPVSVLPAWLQHIAFFLPASHVFEGMRALLFEHHFHYDLLFKAMMLNLVYLAIGVALFLAVFRKARERGLLLNVGE